ncbi:MAG: Alkaline shock protein 23 [Pelotomaculum sp. PtaB.Bin013]|uniref:Asp23/Gls24 family envelope stress response protein n=1 Tax=Pelotomaculum isophthalicicum JI TaxID=947010 RepID=A0A9X4H0J4_9FIRM|nr:Asp23/Gls24 family envelope stress response protein [Pelotomaculum isophthalicicum]MDF9407326.1 Asp23/Gls24 family envelope stress response protein [Pelotomaculum isophthalicicum JI]OPX90621.1 MAG: Alkaline shock protein 23 [Pelotomaculum sp. PtaB.Bin013]
MDDNGNQVIIDEGGSGTIKISEDVVKIIAGLAATEVEGVSGMSGGLAGGIAEKLGHKNMSKGVKAEVGEKEATIDIHVIVEYGCRIQEVAYQIQTKVRNAVESMTGLKVLSVNVNVQGVSFGPDNKEEDGKIK